MKVRTIEGFSSLRAFNAYNALLLGLKMLPAYAGETYEAFLARAQEMPRADQETLFREAVAFVELQKDEVEALLSFVEDKNGVALSASVKSQPPAVIIDAIVAVCMRIAAFKIDLVSESEKKNSEISQ